jgi:hypothetical protein
VSVDERTGSRWLLVAEESVTEPSRGWFEQRAALAGLEITAPNSPCLIFHKGKTKSRILVALEIQKEYCLAPTFVNTISSLKSAVDRRMMESPKMVLSKYIWEHVIHI